MSDLNVTSTTGTAGTYTTYKASEADSSSKTTEAAENSIDGTGVVYEKSESTAKGAYTINKMSQEERTALVEKLKAEQEERNNQLMNIVSQMLGKQANTANIASDDIWKILAGGEFEVDAATKAQAQEDISEDGYWGVAQTSQRIFDFASALAGDDPEKMKEMQEAMEKGFKQAEKTWGKELPSISQETMNAARKLFDDYFASQEETTKA